MSILYLGLDPSRYPRKVFHYPVIETVFYENLDVSKASLATHFLFTSRSAVHYWTYSIGAPVLAIGKATEAALKERGIKPILAPEATQEGMIALLETMEIGFLFWPRSALARSILEEYLTKRGVPFFALDLYTTRVRKKGELPNLHDFDEIVFTSPSTVDAFIEIFGALPRDKKLTAIGPITEAKLFTWLKIYVEG